MNWEKHFYYIPRRRKPNYKIGTPNKLSPNLLNQNFVVNEPNRVWGTSFTYLYLTNGNVHYNCTIIDRYVRSVVANENCRFINSFCEMQGIKQSMSHAGTPYDNAQMERYYNVLKAELIYQYNFRTDKDLDDAVNQFVYRRYN